MAVRYKVQPVSFLVFPEDPQVFPPTLDPSGDYQPSVLSCLNLKYLRAFHTLQSLAAHMRTNDDPGKLPEAKEVLDCITTAKE